MTANRNISPKVDMLWLVWLAAAILFIMFSIVSCKAPQPVQHTIHRTDTIIERERLVSIKVDGTQVTTKLSAGQMDSLTTALKNLPANNRTIYYTDPKLKTQLSFAIDSIGNLVIQCKTLEALYWEKLKEKDHIIERKEYELREQQKSFWTKIVLFFNNGILFILLALVVFTGINWLINRRK